MAPPDVDVRVPGLLTRFTDGRRTVRVRAGTLAEAIDALVEAYPALATHLHDGRGDLRRHLRLFVNGAEVDDADAEAVTLGADDVVVVLQAVSGGGIGPEP